MDRIAEKYHGELGNEWEVKISRDRIHWMVQWARGPRVLDYGCAQGIASKLLKDKGCEVVGYDQDPTAIAYAKGRFPGITFTSDLRDVGGNFDAILLGEILEHQETPARLLNESIGRLGPEGRLIITVPHGYNDCLDHRHLFTMTSVLELVEPVLRIVQLEFKDGFVRLVATPGASDWKATTSVMREAEQDLIELHKRERARAETIEAAYKKEREEVLRIARDLQDLTHRPYVRLARKVSRLGAWVTHRGASDRDE